MSSYTTEDKIRIIRRVVEDGESKSFVATSEGCNRHTIDSWISRYNQNGESGLVSTRGYSKYPESLKQEMLQYSTEHNCTATFLSKRFNVPLSTVKRCTASNTKAKDTSKVVPVDNTDANKLIAQLIKENQRLRMENEVLKKVKASVL